MKKSFGERIFEIINIFLLIILTVFTIYPLWYVFMYSLSDPTVNQIGSLHILPEGGIHLEAYLKVLRTPQLQRVYANTFFVVGMGTLVSITTTTLLAYGLVKKSLPGRKIISVAIVFTMLFSGGMIPTYLVVKSLGLINSLWAMFIPRAIVVYYLLILMSFFRQIPESIEESALIDGCSVPRILISIVLPLSVPYMVTIALFYAVDYWNDFMLNLLYTTDSEKQVLQLLIRNLIVKGSEDFLDVTQSKIFTTPESIKMTTVMVATIPILLVYPFIQKYFISGVTLGAIKG